jgi:DNA-binding transcriptional LysR family regulator
MAVNLKNVDLNLLVIFEAIYATKNISRAADRLAMSQPAVSNALARLRDLLDDPLFVRAPGGVEPTVKARELVTPVREALGLIGRYLDAGPTIDLATYKRLFRIIIIDTLEPLMMPAVVRTITSQAPHIDIECIQPHPKFYEDIRAGTIDLACFAYPIDSTEIVVKAICPVDLVVVARRGHPEITKPLDFETFQRLPHIGLGRQLRGLTNVDSKLAASEMPRRVVYMASKIWAIPPMVERTDLLGLLPRAFVSEVADNFDLDVHELPVEIPEQHIYMMWHPMNEHDPGHIWLRESMMRAMQTNQ